MREPLQKTFEMKHGVLVRHVVPRRGQPYFQKCPLEAYLDVAYQIDEHGERGFVTQDLWEALPETPRTQISVALDFLKERGCVIVDGRRCYAASNVPFEDANIEWYALEHATP